jgi:hypothetical protein
MDMMRAAVVMAAALLLGSTSERPQVNAENVHSLYKSFDRPTPIPMHVSPWLAAACASVARSSDDLAREVERAGPHARALVHLYAHGADESIFAVPERQFPVGTIVVKEKLGVDSTATAVGGMQKMEPGYDPEGGDWLYFYGSRKGGFTSGRLESCRSCHRRAKETDFVYFVSDHEPAGR